MARRMRVTGRAVRRGRGIALRGPESKADAARGAPQDDLDAPCVGEPDPDSVPTRRLGYGRPAAPALCLPSQCLPSQCLPSQCLPSQCLPSQRLTTLPCFGDGPDEREPDADEPALCECEVDVNATTLVSSVAPPADEDLGFEDEFFRADKDSFPPVVEELEPELTPPPASLLPHQKRRRANLRRGVAAAVGAAAVAMLGLTAKATISTTAHHAERHQATAAAVMAHDAPPVAAPPARVEPVAETPAAAVDEPAGPSERASSAEVRKETLRLLNRREFESAATWARRLVELEPKQAFGYRCLGAALQDLGRLGEARGAYSECVRHAKVGDVEECAALGGTR